MPKGVVGVDPSLLVEKKVTREGAEITKRASTGGYEMALKSHIHL